MEIANMICGVFSRITFELGYVGRNFGRNNRPTGVMEKRIINDLLEIKKAQTSRIGEKCNISDHTGRGSGCWVNIITTLVSHTHVGA